MTRALDGNSQRLEATSSSEDHGGWFSTVLPAAGHLNDRLLRGYLRYRDHPQTRKSHYFGGRYENVYIQPARIAGMRTLLDLSLRVASQILGRRSETLRCGFWFNAMAPGQRTTSHTHDDGDELLAAVYYVHVPPDSGDLILYLDRQRREEVVPEPGRLVLFGPQVPHEVTVNRSPGMRLSVAMNFGPQRDGR